MGQCLSQLLLYKLHIATSGTPVPVAFSTPVRNSTGSYSYCVVRDRKFGVPRSIELSPLIMVAKE